MQLLRQEVNLLLKLLVLNGFRLESELRYLPVQLVVQELQLLQLALRLAV